MTSDNSLVALKLIRRAGRVTRTDLARQMGVSLSLAGKVTAGLLETGLIRTIGRDEAEVGRPADLLALTPQAGYAVGLDFGGERQIAVLTDLAGEVVASIDEPARVSAERQVVLETIQSLIERVVAGSGLASEAALGVGVGLRFSVDPITGVVYGWPGMPGWETVWANFPLRQALTECLPDLPHLLVDDIVRPLGVAEAHYGQGRLDEDFLYLLVDSGIGMAILMNGVPYIGHSHIAGEIGHVPVPGFLETCACGNTGCLENLASSESILAHFKQRLDEMPVRSTWWLEEREPDIHTILKAATEGNRLAYQLLTEAGEGVGQVLATVLNLFGPRLVIVGGVLSGSEVYLEAARRTVKLRALEQAARVAVIIRSRLDNLAGARGAATLVLNAVFESPAHHILELRGRGQETTFSLWLAGARRGASRFGCGYIDCPPGGARLHGFTDPDCAGSMRLISGA